MWGGSPRVNRRRIQQTSPDQRRAATAAPAATATPGRAMDVIKDWIVKNVAEFVGRPHSSGSTFHDRVVAVLNGHPEYSFRRIGPHDGRPPPS